MSSTGENSTHEGKGGEPLKVSEQPAAPTAAEAGQGVDDAWKYLDQNRGEEHAAVDLRSLRRKIDFRIVPLMFGAYTMQFLDKVILNYAAVMGLQVDLGLQGNDFSNIATFLFVGLLCFEIPNSESRRSRDMLLSTLSPP